MFPVLAAEEVGAGVGVAVAGTDEGFAVGLAVAGADDARGVGVGVATLGPVLIGAIADPELLFEQPTAAERAASDSSQSPVMETFIEPAPKQ